MTFTEMALKFPVTNSGSFLRGWRAISLLKRGFAIVICLFNSSKFSIFCLCGKQPKSFHVNELLVNAGKHVAE